MKIADPLILPSWRWWGPNDPVGLWDIAQSGAAGIVTALHHIPVGEIWTQADIQQRQALISKVPGLRWVVVESLPVHDAIKRGAPERDALIDRYRTSLQNLGACGVHTICYNFMPVLDWLRTDHQFRLPTGATGLNYDHLDVVVFDRYMLQRPEAEKDYSAELWAVAAERFGQMSSERRKQLEQYVLLGLPGASVNFTLKELREGLARYEGIDAAALRSNLIYFLEAIMPAAQEAGVHMAIHPDDPPWPVFGLPRVVSTASDLDALFEAVPAEANGLTYCTGSLGALPANDLTGILQQWHERIHFLHLRSVQHTGWRQFHESGHLEGHTDMPAIYQFLGRLRREGKLKKDLPMRPDHGHVLLDDHNKQFYPGYPAVGRLRGLAELRGVEMAVRYTEG